MRTQHEAANAGWFLKSHTFNWMQHRNLETPSCTLFWCLLDFTCTCPKASAVKPFPIPTLSCQPTWRSTNARGLFLTLPPRCIPRKMRIKLWMSTPICISKTFGEMVEHICVNTCKESSCAVLENYFTWISTWNLRQQTFWISKQLWQCLGIQKRASPKPSGIFSRFSISPHVDPFYFISWTCNSSTLHVKWQPNHNVSFIQVLPFSEPCPLCPPQWYIKLKFANWNNWFFYVVFKLVQNAIFVDSTKLHCGKILNWNVRWSEGESWHIAQVCNG